MREHISRHTKKVLIAIAGGIVVIVGIVLIPYPGPGWLIVFAGLAILSTKFAWARRLLQYGRRKYNAWTEWVKRQTIPIRLIILLFTGLVIVITVWLVNGFGIMNNFLQSDQSWSVSPFFR